MIKLLKKEERRFKKVESVWPVANLETFVHLPEEAGEDLASGMCCLRSGHLDLEEGKACYFYLVGGELMLTSGLSEYFMSPGDMFYSSGDDPIRLSTLSQALYIWVKAN